jgi:hypothetical protein
LQGAEVEMSGRVMVAGGDLMQAPDGTVGIHMDEFPEAAALLPWKNGEFLEIERAATKAVPAGSHLAVGRCPPAPARHSRPANKDSKCGRI